MAAKNPKKSHRVVKTRKFRQSGEQCTIQNMEDLPGFVRFNLFNINPVLPTKKSVNTSTESGDLVKAALTEIFLIVVYYKLCRLGIIYLQKLDQSAFIKLAKTSMACLLC